jgi:hypothetical protein
LPLVLNDLTDVKVLFNHFSSLVQNIDVLLMLLALAARAKER